MGYGENSWDVLRWLLAQRLFRRKVGQLPVGWFIYNLHRSVDRSLVPGLLWEQMRKPRGFKSLHSDHLWEHETEQGRNLQ